MPASQLTELALRAAVNTTKRDLTAGANQSDSIQNVALSRARELINGSADLGAISSQLLENGAAIHIAMQGLKLAYSALSKQMEVLKNQRLAFDKERQAGIATFLVPTDKEEGQLSIEEKVLKGFLEGVEKNASFSTYLGIHSAELLTDTGSKFYSVLPFYRMSEAIGQPVASPRPLDRQRTAIHLFFKSALPDAIADIDMRFQADWGFVSFWQSAFQGRNYLNDRRAPRFIMICISNLLWNLQYPIDPETGFPLGLRRSIELCRETELFINQLLNTEAPPYLHEISNEENGLVSFLRKIETHTKALRLAYAEEHLHELNFDEITNSAHRALRIMDKSVFKLVYRRQNVLTKKEEPDDKAAEKMAYVISYLNQLLTRNPDLLHAFSPPPEWMSAETEMNHPPMTVVDILIIFAHLSWRQRDKFLSIIKKSTMGSAIEFAETLKKFDQKFIKPIKEVSKKELQTTLFHPKHQEVGCLTAQRLVPLMTLVIEDYRIDVDTPYSQTRTHYAESHPTSPQCRRGKQQVHAINQSAETGRGYYQWVLSPFITKSPLVPSEIDELPKRQYRLTQITKLMDNVGDLLQHYRHFLHHAPFQTFLLKCLTHVKEEYTALEQHIEKVDQCLGDEHINRNLQAILRPMIRDLNNSLRDFALATTSFETLVSAPDFTDQQRQLLASKLGSISEQFTTLFEEDSGVERLIALPTSSLPIQEIPAPNVLTDRVEARQVIALRKLVMRCYNALSHQSREGHKGDLIRELLTIIEGQPHFTEAQIKHLVMDLTRVTASYRETWIFQASYGQTRSARALISAMRDPSLNSILPLASILFEGSGMQFKQVSDAQILQRLKSLRGGHHWQESVEQIKLVTL